MAALIIMGVGTAVAAGGQLFSGLSAGRAAREQAEAQKKATSRYAKALKAQASRMQGGMSGAQMRTMQTGAALDRAALGQMARDEAKRGGQRPSIPHEAELAASLQTSAAEQQRTLDQLSAQEARNKADQRSALRSQALQLQAQAQSIDPNAVARAARAGTAAQVAGTLGNVAAQAALPTAQAQLSGMTGQKLLSQNETLKQALSEGKKFEDLSASDQLAFGQVRALQSASNRYNLGGR